MTLRTFIWLLFLVTGLCSLHAQSEEAEKGVPPKTENKEKQEKAGKKDESFGEYVKKAGLGVWRRVKYRFNLDGATEDIKKKGRQFFKKKEEKDSETTDAPKSPDPPKDETNEKKDG